MKEHSLKKVNVLGIDVSVLRPEKAVNLSMDYMKRKGLETVFFLSAESSLFCQNHPSALEFIRSCRLVLTGDRSMETAVLHKRDEEIRGEGIGEYADEYLKRLFMKLNREKRDIYAVVEKQEKIDFLLEYINKFYPDIYVDGIVLESDIAGGPGKVVNEINANIPDVVFICLPVDQQITFAREYASMMNTRLCICIESVQPLIQKETGSVSPVLHFLHLDGFWHHLQKESILKRTIVDSVFRKKIIEDAVGESELQDNRVGNNGVHDGASNDFDENQ